MADFLRVFCRTTCIVAVVLGVVGATLFFLPKYKELRDRETRCKSLQAAIEFRQKEIKDIRLRQQRLQSDPSFVERVARENRRIRPNEIVFLYEVAP